MVRAWMGVGEKNDPSVTTAPRCRGSDTTRERRRRRRRRRHHPLSASAKRKSGLKIQLNLGGVKVQKMGGTEATDNDGGNKKEEPDDDQQP